MSRTFRRRFFQTQASRAAKNRSIEMDAILYSVSETLRRCTVKIQGSDTTIVCDYPEGYQQTPFYLKPGQAVRIQRKGGIRGRMEVIGIGQTIPTGITYPGITTSVDAVISGCQVVAIPQVE